MLAGLREVLRAELDAKHIARETALRCSRDSIRASANAIRAIHRGEFTDAARLIDESGRLVRAARDATEEHGDVRYAGFVADAEKEHAEAQLTAALVRGEGAPTPGAIGVGAVAWLNGLGEVVGELRRELLDRLRREDLAGAELAMAQMDEIYELLVSIDYPDAMTGGLRRTTDAARGIIERSRSDLTTGVVAARLAAHLDRAIATRQPET